MVRKKKHSEHVNHQRWLVSYADLITLLFAFFVVLFAASNSDQKKAGQVANAVQVAFKQMAVFTPTGKVVPLYEEGRLPFDTKSVIGNADAEFDSTQLVASGKQSEIAKSTIPKATITEVKEQLQKVLKQEIQKNSVRLAEDSRGLTISLAEAGFFDPGSAFMHTESLAVVDRIAETLRPLGYNLRVEGHTDNTPIHTAQFPSNWELSTGRATFVLKYLITDARIPPQRLSAVGYGEYRPVAANSTPEGRAANRRVDLVVLGAAALKEEPQVQ